MPPAHSRTFQSLCSERLARGFDYTASNRQLLIEEFLVAEASFPLPVLKVLDLLDDDFLLGSSRVVSTITQGADNALSTVFFLA